MKFVNGELQTPLMQPYKGTYDLTMVLSVSPVFAHAPSKKGFIGFAIDFG